MSTTSQIPVTAGTPQRFTITLSGVEYQMTLRFNQFLAAWVLNLGLPDGTALIDGLTLVTGEDLLAQYRHLGIPGSLTVVGDADVDSMPTFAQFGTDSHFLYTVD